MRDSKYGRAASILKGLRHLLNIPKGTGITSYEFYCVNKTYYFHNRKELLDKYNIIKSSIRELYLK